MRTQDIVVFDEESDRHVVIPWEDAVEASYVRITNGNANSMAHVFQGAEVLSGGSGLASAEATEWYTDAATARVGTGTAAAPQYPLVGQGLAGHKTAGKDDKLLAGEWRELANCWWFIAKHGADGDHGAGAGRFPFEDPKAGAAGSPWCITNNYRGGNMQTFMQVPAFRVYCVMSRPFIEHLMMSAIMTVSGRDTGAMLFGPSDMQISANTQVKTIEG